MAVVALILSWATVAARADVVAVVSASNPTSRLTRSQVMDIFLSRSSHFPDGREAVPIDQREGSPARDAFYTLYASMSAAQIKAFWSKIIFTGRGQPPMSVDSGAEEKRRVASDPNAIGYIEQSLVDATVKVVLDPSSHP
jgi:ABC-type phosphate transport system substrate-binding protein